MSDLHDRLVDSFRDKDYRHAYVTESLSTRISTQIRVLREQRDLTQAGLAARTGMKQAAVSRLENVDYASWNIRTLARLAEAFDVALDIRFVSFGEILDEICRFSRQRLERPSFEDDPVFSGTTGTARMPGASAPHPAADAPLRFLGSIGRSTSWNPRGGISANAGPDLLVSSVSCMTVRDAPRQNTSAVRQKKGARNAGKRRHPTPAG